MQCWGYRSVCKTPCAVGITGLSANLPCGIDVTGRAMYRTLCGVGARGLSATPIVALELRVCLQNPTSCSGYTSVSRTLGGVWVTDMSAEPCVVLGLLVCLQNHVWCLDYTSVCRTLSGAGVTVLSAKATTVLGFQLFLQNPFSLLEVCFCLPDPGVVFRLQICLQNHLWLLGYSSVCRAC